jgi:hypothetical protein
MMPDDLLETERKCAPSSLTYGIESGADAGHTKTPRTSSTAKTSPVGTATEALVRRKRGIVESPGIPKNGS